MPHGGPSFDQWSELELEFQESDVSPGQTDVKQGKFVECISPAKGYYRETYKSQNLNPISQTLKFNLRMGRVCEQNFWYHVAAFFIPFRLICNISCSEKLNFYLLTPDPWVLREGVWVRIICCHVAAFLILFNLICSMIIFWNSCLLTYWPGQVYWGLWAKYLLPCCCIS